MSEALATGDPILGEQAGEILARLNLGEDMPPALFARVLRSLRASATSEEEKRDVEERRDRLLEAAEAGDPGARATLELALRRTLLDSAR